MYAMHFQFSSYSAYIAKRHANVKLLESIVIVSLVMFEYRYFVWCGVAVYVECMFQLSLMWEQP